MQIKDLFDTFTQKIKLHFWPLPVSSQQHPVKQAGNKESANLCKTMIIRKKCVSVANSLHDDWTLTTKWDLCKKSIPTWSLDYREAIDTPTLYFDWQKLFMWTNLEYVMHFSWIQTFMPTLVLLTYYVLLQYTFLYKWGPLILMLISIYFILDLIWKEVLFSRK